MPADEVTHGTGVEEFRVRTGPRHAAPKKPLFTRFHMPAGKAIAMAAMPTAVLMGMGFTSTHAVADNNASKPSAKSLTADEYKDCVAALDGSRDEPSASPTPSASASAGDAAEGGDGATATPAPSATSATGQDGQADQNGRQDEGSSHASSSPGTASGDKAAPKPAPTASESKPGGSGTGGAATTAPPASGGGGLLGTVGDTLGGVGDALGGLLAGGKQGSGASADPGAAPSASATPAAGGSKDTGDGASDPVKDTARKVTDTVKDTVEGTVKDTTGTVSRTAGKAVEGVKDTAGEAAGEAADAATASPSPSASSTTDPEDCPAATDAEGGVDNDVLLADDPWYLDASSLLLKGADYQGVVEVRTASGKVKKVLKYVISDGTDIGDLHQTVKDEGIGKTYHVQAAKGSISTIRNGDTVMYTESISGNLFGLIPVTFSPKSPPPLNIPLIYFTKVKVVQAAQFGGDLHVPGMRQYTTD
ncbi:hypothetical protein ACF09J_32955 [Streptomyces sp. NPDC014889]|uniref:hypothetical protein n=1 Tax=Streptomyces sp. NPDC014889 TaxID=3364928 RepID=UPI0036F51711